MHKVPLMVGALQFEKVENKPVVVGYIAAAVSALIVAEWLVHLPALDIVSPASLMPGEFFTSGVTQCSNISA